MYSITDLPDELVADAKARQDRRNAFRAQIEAAKAEILGPVPENKSLEILHTMATKRLEDDIAVFVPELEDLKKAAENDMPFHLSHDAKTLIRLHQEFDESAVTILVQYGEKQARENGVEDAEGYYASIVQRFETKFARLFELAANPSPASGTDHHPLAKPAHAQPAFDHS